mmetsp:Transcript_18744/g.48073  ORF Transcript_18744/g.48073 Transcript_18744/m.48073 type:complete len:289 (+) Transcript_18744:486-1352(+)
MGLFPHAAAVRVPGGQAARSRAARQPRTGARAAQLPCAWLRAGVIPRGSDRHIGPGTPNAALLPDAVRRAGPRVPALRGAWRRQPDRRPLLHLRPPGAAGRRQPRGVPRAGRLRHRARQRWRPLQRAAAVPHRVGAPAGRAGRQPPRAAACVAREHRAALWRHARRRLPAAGALPRPPATFPGGSCDLPLHPMANVHHGQEKFPRHDCEAGAGLRLPGIPSVGGDRDGAHPAPADAARRRGGRLHALVLPAGRHAGGVEHHAAQLPGGIAAARGRCARGAAPAVAAAR